MVSHGVLWCLMMSHGVSWCLMVSYVLQACAVLGLLVVPLAYLTVWELMKSTVAAFTAATIILCGEERVTTPLSTP